jgi:hypothetical protein
MTTTNSTINVTNRFNIDAAIAPKSRLVLG